MKLRFEDDIWQLFVCSFTPETALNQEKVIIRQIFQFLQFFQKLEAGGKPSTWFPPEGLVEQSRVTKKPRKQREHTWTSKGNKAHPKIKEEIKNTQKDATCANKRTIKQTKKRTNEHTSKRTKERANKQTNKRTNKQTRKQTIKQSNMQAT